MSLRTQARNQAFRRQLRQQMDVAQQPLNDFRQAVQQDDLIAVQQYVNGGYIPNPGSLKDLLTLAVTNEQLDMVEFLGQLLRDNPRGPLSFELFVFYNINQVSPAVAEVLLELYDWNSTRARSLLNRLISKGSLETVTVLANNSLIPDEAVNQAFLLAVKFNRLDLAEVLLESGRILVANLEQALNLARGRRARQLLEEYQSTAL